MAKRLLKDESGQTMAYMGLVILGVLLIAAFAIDLGMANFVSSRQSSISQQALAKCVEPACVMKVKNSEQPGHALCSQLVTFLRDEGFDGEICAYYYEPTSAESGLGDDRRVYVFGAVLGQETPAIFSRLITATSSNVRTADWSYTVPYASERVFKPASPDNGCLVVDAGAATGTWNAASSVSSIEAQVEMNVREQLEEAVSYAEGI